MENPAARISRRAPAAAASIRAPRAESASTAVVDVSLGRGPTQPERTRARMSENLHLRRHEVFSVVSVSDRIARAPPEDGSPAFRLGPRTILYTAIGLKQGCRRESRE